MSLQVQSLSKLYGTQKAVDNISFGVQPGDILGFLGPNGAGKSTTMKIATTYLPPDEGSILVCGYDVSTQAQEVRQCVGYLPEHNPLYLDMYVHEYLLFIASLHQLKGSKAIQRTKDMVALTGLGREQHKKIGALSKGYRQRVGLAQALIHDPQVLILDEPTTGLDPNQIGEIRQLIKQIASNKTVIFSTHILQEVKAICNRAVIINRGKIVADGQVSKLLQQQGNVIIKLELQHPADLNLLSQVEGVLEIHTTGENSIYQLTCSHDIRAALSSCVAANGWILLGMQIEEASLEQIFASLTNA
jgi:ABC-2 type transport system ATP-binding protein